LAAKLGWRVRVGVGARMGEMRPVVGLMDERPVAPEASE
jgi:hypothetical protein